MKKYLSLAFLLFVPFFANAQQAPELYITDLSTQKTDYKLGETIKGSFLLHNTSDFDASDIYYSLSLGEISESGNHLKIEADTSERVGAYFINSDSRKIINFSYKPEINFSGNTGIQVNVERKDGTKLSWDALPVSLSGEEVDLIDGFLFTGSNSFYLTSGPTVDSEIYLVIDSDNVEEGDEFDLKIFERNFDSSPVFDETVEVQNINDDLLGVELPNNFKPKVYVGSLNSNSTTELRFKYIISGIQAEVLNITSSKLSLRKGEQFDLNVSYAGGASDYLRPEVDNTPDKVRFIINVENENGEVVSNVDFINNVPKEKLDSGEILNTFIQNFPLKSNAEALQLNIDVSIYDVNSGNLLDEYSTSFPIQQAQESSFVTLTNLIILLVVILIIAAIVGLFNLKHKIPTVCFAILFTSVLSAGVIIYQNDASALELVSGGGSNGDLVLSSPSPSTVAGYEPGEIINMSGIYNIWACGNNGFVNSIATAPVSDYWHNFGSAQEAANHIVSNDPGSGKITDLLAIIGFVDGSAGCNLHGGGFSCYKTVEDLPEGSVYWYTPPQGRNALTFPYYRIPKENSYYKTFLGGSAAKTSYIETTLVAPDEPGIYYIPVTSRYCTTSHGCSEPKTYVQDICVNGGGYCPGEEEETNNSVLSCSSSDYSPKPGDTVTYTANITNPDDSSDQRFWWPNTEQPEGTTENTYTVTYTENDLGDQSFDIIAASGGEEYGPASCDVTVTEDGDPEDPGDNNPPGGGGGSFGASCSISPSNVDIDSTMSPAQLDNVVFNIDTWNADGAVSYDWSIDDDGSFTHDGSSFNLSDFVSSVEVGNSFFFEIDVTDGSSSAEAFCSVNVTQDGTNITARIASFSLSPVVEPCEVDFEAQGVQSCTVGGQTYTDQNGDGLINKTDFGTKSLPSGTYYLTCNDNLGFTISRGPSVCISNPNVIEE